MDEIEEKLLAEKIEAEENKARIDAEAVTYTINTDGWKLISKRLKEEQDLQQKVLLNIAMLPENLGQLTLAQAHVKGINFIFDMIDDLKNKNQIV